MSNQSYLVQPFGRLSVLAPEIRDIIYEFALVEPPKWERLSEHWHHSLENNQHPSCRGRVWKGIGLLRVNKAIHTEAAPVFLSQNIFFFITRNEFIKCIGIYLRLRYRSLVRHVRIAHVMRNRVERSTLEPRSWDWNPDDEQVHFEKALGECTGLRTLGIDIDLVTQYQLNPPCLDVESVRTLAGLISPEVQFSFLKQGSISPAMVMAVGRRRTHDSLYRTLSQMPYNLHDEAVTGTKATENGVPEGDWELVYKQPQLSGRFITFSQIFEYPLTLNLF
ncbi:hypothetical protein F5B22DRAFT_657445 [Xylaria bambusicola]|uniref:uncharacterized protein n=1 Tax=Xylaria bambusicola TaxID=326684 RepID=UPI0020083AA6|nr:uncharacterized protein F5B22DRAFT_657445 [Xylaria bambusicola]KAI0513016.1 hypothetical protein F5B22DRAFT_657445 [Xylaria bambusicola]